MNEKRVNRMLRELSSSHTSAAGLIWNAVTGVFAPAQKTDRRTGSSQSRQSSAAADRRSPHTQPGF